MVTSFVFFVIQKIFETIPPRLLEVKKQKKIYNKPHEQLFTWLVFHKIRVCEKPLYLGFKLFYQIITIYR